MIPIYCYIPKDDWPAGEIPQDIDVLDIDAYLQPLGTPTNVGTSYNWTLQTYLRLKVEGFPCTLSGVLPQEGIVLACRGSLPFGLKPTPKLLIVCILADAISPHPWAQLHVVQNSQQTLTIKDSYHIPHWPQPGLIPRNPARNDHFENIAYFGDVANLAPELRCLSWQEQVNSIGLNWSVMKPGCWNEYSNVDAIIAIRSFERQDYIWKPASKLYNAWHAGVPAILGQESAYRAERRSELDYIEVTSLGEVVSALKRLRDDRQLYKAMIENGRIRAEETSSTNLVTQWRDFITQTAIPAYERWCTASNLSRQSFFIQRYLALRIMGVRERVHSLIA